jgi:hypothetical protein
LVYFPASLHQLLGNIPDIPGIVGLTGRKIASKGRQINTLRTGPSKNKRFFLKFTHQGLGMHSSGLSLVSGFFIKKPNY